MALRIGVVGAGFWSTYQIAGWREIDDAEVVAVCDVNRAKAERFGVAAYDSVESMLSSLEIDLLDIVTPVETHATLVLTAAERGLPVVCQKPMSQDIEEARSMVETCARYGVPFFVNENWRYQAPIRRVKALLDAGTVGNPFRARVQFSCSFPVFDNQPFLRASKRFILADVGSHIFDVARYLFGEASSLFCLTDRVGDLAGENVATVLLAMERCGAVTCELSYASRLRDEAFPQTYLVIEGSEGSIELRKGYRVLSPAGDEIAAPDSYPWADPAYDLVHSSIVDCQRAIVADLRQGVSSGLRGADNLKTVELVFGSYESAALGRSISVGT